MRLRRAVGSAKGGEGGGLVGEGAVGNWWVGRDCFFGGGYMMLHKPPVLVVTDDVKLPSC